MKQVITSLFFLLLSLTASAQNGEFVGGDISILPLYETHNTGYRDTKGNNIDDLISWFVSECGWNSFRVRLFVDPKEKNQKGETDHCVCQNIDFVKKLGKRIKDAGAYFVLDIHYSDTWADPSSQILPASWSDCTTAAKKADKVYSYTKEVLQTLKDAGAKPDFVQVGNETTYGMIGIKVFPYDHASNDWAGLTKVFSYGCKAVREVCPDAKIIIHTERSGVPGQTVYYYNKLKDANVDYDIIGLSYYPFYHDGLSTLSSTLSNLSAQFPDKKVQIMETSYPFQYYPGDKKYDLQSKWKASADGQYQFTKDLIDLLKTHKNVNALYWWQPEEAGNGDDSNWETGPGATVMTSWMTRGMWWCDQKFDGHWPVVSSQGFVGKLLSSFLNTTGINDITAPEPGSDSDAWFTISGIRIDKPTKKGLYIHSGKVISVK